MFGVSIFQICFNPLKKIFNFNRPFFIKANYSFSNEVRYHIFETKSKNAC